MIFLTVDEIISLHNQLIAKTGGIGGMRDVALLQSAVANANATFDGVGLYPSVAEKSASLAFAIINNHAFIDGNKRIGILVMLITLRLNKIEIKYSQKELVELGLSVASGQCQYDCLYAWIKAHRQS